MEETDITICLKKIKKTKSLHNDKIHFKIAIAKKD